MFVSEELATFFQEEKKFNTTWEGDAVGMVRLLAVLEKIDLEQVRRTGELARAGLDALAEAYSGLIENVRGAGVMLAFDVPRADCRTRFATVRSDAVWCSCLPASGRCASILATTPSHMRSPKAWRS